MIAKTIFLLFLIVFVGGLWISRSVYAASPLALDGVGVNNCPLRAFCSSQSLTTTRGHDVVLLIFECVGGLIPCEGSAVSINSESLTFIQRLSYANSSNAKLQLFEYYAVSTSLLRSENVTVIVPNHFILGMQVFAVSGANTREIFDPDPSVPATVSYTLSDCSTAHDTCSASIHTSAKDFVVASTFLDDAPGCGAVHSPEVQVPGFTNISTPNGWFEVDYTIGNTPRSNVTFSCNSTDVVVIVLDAISFHALR